jgi:hypothetical protein
MDWSQLSPTVDMRHLKSTLLQKSWEIFFIIIITCGSYFRHLLINKINNNVINKKRNRKGSVHSYYYETLFIKRIRIFWISTWAYWCKGIADIILLKSFHSTSYFIKKKKDWYCILLCCKIKKKERH